MTGTTEMPPMPSLQHGLIVNGEFIPVYSADQMRAYAQQYALLIVADIVKNERSRAMIVRAKGEKG